MSEENRRRWPATRLLRAFERGDLTPVEATQAALEQAEAHTHLNAFREVWAEEALAQARQAAWRYRQREPIGLLDGLPTAIKDSFDLRGTAARAGSRLTGEEPQPQDSPSVAALRQAGCIFLGRTTMPEFGWKGVCDSPLTGATRNPHDPQLTPGGSSGGDGAAVATGASTVAIGADIGGSVRIPASFCGVVAFKPTHDRASRQSGSHASVLSREGPMARSVADAALVLDVTESAQRGDPGATRGEKYYRSALGNRIGGMRLGLQLEHPEATTDPQVARCVADAMEVFRDLGVEVVELDSRRLDLAGYRHAYECLLGAELAGEVSQFGAEERRLLDPGLLEMVEQIESASAMDLVRASGDRRRLLHHVASFFRDFDLLATPTVPILPFAAGREVPKDWPERRWTTWTPFTWPFNMSGSPAASVPCGFVGRLPVGLQLVAERRFDSQVLRAASLFERTLALEAAE